MDRVKVESSQIVSVGHDAKNSVLEILFKSGQVYQYKNVTEEMYTEMLAAASAGAYFAKNIKRFPEKYPFTFSKEEKPAWGEKETAAGTAKVKAVSTEEIEKKTSPLPEKARKMIVVNNEQYMAAAEFLKGIKALRAEVDAAFDPIIQKAHEAHKEALRQKKRAESPLVEAEGIVKASIGGYLRREEERQEEERRKLEKQLEDSIRAQAEEENIARAQELAAAGDMEGAAAAVDAEIEIPKVPVHVESRVVPVAGISRRKTFKAEVVDLMALVKAVAEGRAPLQCLEPSMVFLNAQARAFKEAGPLLDNEFKPNMGVRIVETDGIAASSK